MAAEVYVQLQRLFSPPTHPYTQSTLILKFRSDRSSEKTINCSIDGLELFSCALCNEDETALSILDPVSISVDVRPPPTSGGRTSRPPSTSGSGDNGSAQVLEVSYVIKILFQATCRLHFSC